LSRHSDRFIGEERGSLERPRDTDGGRGEAGAAQPSQKPTKKLHSECHRSAQ